MPVGMGGKRHARAAVLAALVTLGAIAVSCARSGASESENNGRHPFTAPNAASGRPVVPGGSGASTSGTPRGTVGGRVAPPARTDRPNIVFVLTDDLSTNLLAHMPNVRALQRDGTTLSRFHVVDSLCCPSRAATFTGQYPHTNGVFTNTGPDGGYGAYNRHGNARNSFAVSLQRAGYRTGYFGKYLNDYNPYDPVPPGWSDWHASDNAYRGFDYTMNENGVPRLYGSRPRDYLTDVVSRRANEFVRTSHQPFMLEVATFAPHEPAVPAPRHARFGNRITYPWTPAYDTLQRDPPPWQRSRPALTRGEKNRLLTNYRKRVASVQSVDELVGALRATLRARGIARDTYVVFSSDNGFHMGEYRLLSGKQTAYDTDIRVPLVVAGPGVPVGRTDDRLASNIDLAPTFETIAGARVGSHVDGTDLSPLWHGVATPRWQRGVLVEHHGPSYAPDDPDRVPKWYANPPDYVAVRTADALYVEYRDGHREYYDTRTDPYELDNLARRGVPGYLPRMLHALQRCAGATACQQAAGR